MLAGSGDPQTAKNVDPITGLALCADHGAVDGTDEAVYTLPPAEGAGYTLLGSATVVADIATEGRDCGDRGSPLGRFPEGTMKLVARAIYRPDPVGRQVFQLHPNGWHFGPGHSAAARADRCGRAVRAAVERRLDGDDLEPGAASPRRRGAGLPADSLSRGTGRPRRAPSLRPASIRRRATSARFRIRSRPSTSLRRSRVRPTRSPSPPQPATPTARSPRRPGTSTATANTTTPPARRPSAPSKRRAGTRWACRSPTTTRAARPSRGRLSSRRRPLRPRRRSTTRRRSPGPARA